MIHIIDQREVDVRKLCREVINTAPSVSYNGNGPDDSTCPFCYGRVYHDAGTMEEIKHDADCAYLIAKDLMTNID